jgi:hypothetical protein
MTEHSTLTDRELDAALEKRLFGWQGRKVPGEGGWTFPHYSTTGDGMLKVLEAMRERSRSIRLHWNDVSKLWVAWFSDRPWAPGAAGDLYQDESSDASLPRAVALAALAALEQGVTP